MIRMKCPTCARTIGIDEAYVGKLALCPACHGTFTVPAPAVLLDERPASLAPPDSSTSPAAASHAAPLLPDGPIPLAPQKPPPLSSSATDSGLFGPGEDWELRGSADDWSRSEPRLRPLTPEVPPPPSADPPRPVEQPAAPALPPVGTEVKDWQFLALDAPSAEAQAPAKPQAAFELPALSEPVPPIKPVAEDEPLPLSLEPLEEEAHVPLRLEPAGPLVAEPVLEHDGPVHLPVSMEPIPLVSDPQLSQIPEALVTPVGIVPPEVVTPAYDMLPPNLPPPLLAEPPAPPRPEVEPMWGRDGNNFDARKTERDPFRPRKKRREYGFVSLVPGLDDFYLGLIVLGAIWLMLGILVIVSPRLCMVPIIVGAVVWTSAAFWMNACVREADPYWKVLFFTPVLTTPMSFILGNRALLVLGFVIVQLWAAFFAFYFRDRALRAFAVTCLGMLMSGMGWAAMPRTTSAEENLNNPPPIVQGGP